MFGNHFLSVLLLPFCSVDIFPSTVNCLCRCYAASVIILQKQLSIPVLNQNKGGDLYIPYLFNQQSIAQTISDLRTHTLEDRIASLPLLPSCEVTTPQFSPHIYCLLGLQVTVLETVSSYLHPANNSNPVSFSVS